MEADGYVTEADVVEVEARAAGSQRESGGTFWRKRAAAFCLLKDEDFARACQALLLMAADLTVPAGDRLKAMELVLLALGIQKSQAQGLVPVVKDYLGSTSGKIRGRVRSSTATKRVRNETLRWIESEEKRVLAGGAKKRAELLDREAERVADEHRGLLREIEEAEYEAERLGEPTTPVYDLDECEES